MKKLFIIDLMPFLYRGHFVFLKSPRMTSTGINTSALLGFANGVTSILKDFSPTHAVLAMDPGGPTFRHEAYPPYKAQREKMPEDLAASIPYAFELAEALRIPVLRKEGFEADDVMGTLAVRAASEGFDVYLATPDKDAAQLVAPHIRLFRPGRSGGDPEIYDEAKVCEHWQLTSPRQMIDWLALAGDASDNIPGVRGVGEKTATTLLAQYGSVENLIEHAAELKGKLAEKIASGADDARTSKFLTTIRTDVPLDVSFDDFLRKEPDAEKLRAVCTKFELNALARRFLGEDALPSEKPAFKTLADVPHDYRLVQTLDEAAALARELEAAPKFAFDTETTSTDARTARLVGMSFATEKGKAWYVAVPHHLLPTEAPPPAQDLFEAARPAGEGHGEALTFVATFAAAFADPGKTLVAQNAKFDMTVLSRYGIRFGSTVRDTMLEHYVLDAAAFHNMDFLAREYLGYDPIPITRLIGERKRGEQQKNMADISPSEVCDYAAEDADVTLQLDEVLRPKVAEAGALQALAESEEPLVPILSAMERVGVRIDTSALRAYGFELDKEIVALTESIRAAANDPELNVDSPKQVGELLFDKLKLDASGTKTTATGQYATDEKTLLKIVGAHPVVRQILEYRACSKLKGTYVDKLPQCIDPLDGRVHTTFAQALTETGRLSSYVRAGPYRDGAALLLGPEPAEHPHPHGTRQTHPRRHRAARRGPRARLGRLLADRASDHGRDERRRDDARRLRARSGHPPRDGRARLRRDARARDGRHAPEMQDGELRHHLRHLRVRARAAPAGAAARGGRPDRDLLPALPEDPRVHGHCGGAGARDGLRRDGARPPPDVARHLVAQRDRAPGRRARRDQHARAGHGCGSHQARDGEGRPRVQGRGTEGGDDPPDPRRTALRHAPRRSRAGEGNREARDGRGHEPRRAA